MYWQLECIDLCYNVETAAMNYTIDYYYILQM